MESAGIWPETKTRPAALIAWDWKQRGRKRRWVSEFSVSQSKYNLLPAFLVPFVWELIWGEGLGLGGLTGKGCGPTYVWTSSYSDRTREAGVWSLVSENCDMWKPLHGGPEQREGWREMEGRARRPYEGQHLARRPIRITAVTWLAIPKALNTPLVRSCHPCRACKQTSTNVGKYDLALGGMGQLSRTHGGKSRHGSVSWSRARSVSVGGWQERDVK